MKDIQLRRPTDDDIDRLSLVYKNSKTLHNPWTFPPEDLEAYVKEPHRFLLCEKNDDELFGTFNISAIVRGTFQSGYLSYEAFAPHQAKGYMKRGMQLLLDYAFTELNLHRLEANIQPGNVASVSLVSGAGFEKEGYSRAYLRLGESDTKGDKEWKDHERWAIINEAWEVKPSS